MDLNGRLRWDLQSGIPLYALSYMLNKCIPDWYIETVYKHMYQGWLKMFDDKWSEKEQVSLGTGMFEMISAGSLGDTLVIPGTFPRNIALQDILGLSEKEFQERQTQFDVDMVFIDKVIVAGYEGSSAKYIIDSTHTRPAYFHLRHKNTDMLMNSDLLKLCAKIGMQNQGQEYEEHGPAISFRVSGARDFDFVSTGCCQSWPREAEAWIKRKCVSGWPNREMRDEIVSRGCNFVAKAHNLSKQPDIEFRFSFVRAAKSIIHRITPRQRQCFIIFKTLFKHYTSDQEFSSYCLKTTFLYSLENIPRDIWQQQFSGLATCVLYLIDELIHGLIEKNVPMYFIPTCNLIEHISGKKLNKNIKQICNLRKDVLGAILEFDENYSIMGLLPVPLSELYLDIVSKAQKCGQSFEKWLVMVRDLEYIYLALCTKYSIMWGFLATIHELTVLSWLLQSDKKPMTTREAITGLLIKCRSVVCSGDDMGFIASVASVFYMNHSNVRTGAFRDLIDDVFRRALALEDQLHHNARHVYYAYFLMHLGRNDEAISVLKKAVLLHKVHDDVIFEYFFIMRNHLDNVLHQLLHERQSLKVPAHLLAYYLLIRLYKDSGRIEDGRSLLGDFTGDCDRCHSNYLHASCYILLAWSCLYVGEFWRAGEAFLQDRTMINPPGRDNIMKMWICRAMAVYYRLKA